MNEVMNAILSRYTCREFTNEPVSDLDMNNLTDAALAAPTAMNREPYQVIVIKDKSLIDRMDQECMERLSKMADKSIYERMMSRGGKLFYNAPMMLMLPILANAQTDVGIVAENIALAATSLGLGSCICGMARLIFEGKEKEAYEKRLGFREGYTFGLAVLVGHAAQEKMPHALDRTKVSYI